MTEVELLQLWEKYLIEELKFTEFSLSPDSKAFFFDARGRFDIMLQVFLIPSRYNLSDPFISISSYSDTWNITRCFNLFSFHGRDLSVPESFLKIVSSCWELPRLTTLTQLISILNQG